MLPYIYGNYSEFAHAGDLDIENSSCCKLVHNKESEMNNLVILDRDQLNTFKSQMLTLVKSGLLPNHVKTPEQAFTIAQMGRELGVPHMTAFSSIYVVSGKPALSADLMLALIRKKNPQAIINFLELTNECCSIEVTRDKAHKPTKISFSMADAERAGIANGATWKKYPRALLRSRCISEMARAIFPDALLGFSYTPEELGAPIDVEGRIDPSFSNESTKGTPKNELDAALEGSGKPNNDKKDIVPEIQGFQSETIDAQFENLSASPQKETVPKEKEPDTQAPAGGVNALAKLEAARAALARGETPSEEPMPEPDSSLGDFVYEVGNVDHPYYKKTLHVIGNNGCLKIMKFLSEKIKNSKANNYELDPKEEEALFMIKRYCIEQGENSK